MIIRYIYIASLELESANCHFRYPELPTSTIHHVSGPRLHLGLGPLLGRLPDGSSKMKLYTCFLSITMILMPGALEEGDILITMHPIINFSLVKFLHDLFHWVLL